METEIVVEYVGANGNTATETFKSWDENGSYTLLYNDVSQDSLRLMIPTQNVLSLRVVTEEDRAEEERGFVEKYVDTIIETGFAYVDDDLVYRVTLFLDKLCKKHVTEDVIPGVVKIRLIEG